MADHSLDQSVYMARPHRVRLIAIIATLALCLLTAIGWFLLPAEVRALFTLSQRLTLLGVLALLIVGMGALASSYVRADANGLRIRNGLRVHAVPWGRVHKIILRPGDPWALLLITPEDGRPFEADLDAEKRQLMGIQAVDGLLAKAAVNELRGRHRRFLEAR
ncbi:MAG TPA: PH domain-containing protein [Propionibacteriaceae bacterium]|nr:PH domain-containing protein [Propionibacteriaceae bacterium]